MVNDIQYMLDQVPQTGKPVRVEEDLYLLRLPLPFALDHVNVWLLEAETSWTIIDSGLGSRECLAIWDSLLSGFLKHKPIEKLILTHYHPDHVGLSGDLVERTGASVYMSRTEWLTANMLFHDGGSELNSAMLRLFYQHGLPDNLYQQMQKTKNIFASRCSSLPATYQRIQHDDMLTISGSNWQCRLGRGHSPEHMALYNKDRKILIAGDHILPKITPNIPMPVQETSANPIDDYINSLKTYTDIDDDVLVLPSHRLPFKGAGIRIEQLILHHHQRLATLYDACNVPVSVHDILPVLFKRELDINQMKFAMLEALSHMRYLQCEGKLERSLTNNVYTYQQA